MRNEEEREGEVCVFKHSGTKTGRRREKELMAELYARAVRCV
jgi:hypothetical protein